MWLVLALGACSGNENDIKEQFPAAAVSPTTLDFGEVAVEYSSTASIEIINSGLADLKVTGVTLDDALNAYTLGEFPAVVDPGARASVDLTFTPPDLTDYAAVVHVLSNDPNYPDIPVTVTGRGVEIPLCEISVTPSSLDFGVVEPLTSATEWFTVANEGEADCIISGTDQLGSGSFEVVGDPDFVVAPGGSTNIVILYTPTIADGDNGTLTFHSNDPDEPDTTVYMLGNGGGDYQYPVAVIDGPATAHPRETLTLDGTGSYDPENYTPLTYEWTLVETPDGSQSLLADPTTLDHTYLPTDVAGNYVVKLQVTNSIGLRSAPAYYTADAIPEELFHVELSWNTGGADLDLHVLTSEGTLFGVPYDANYCNQTPEWGASGSADNPSLDIDDQSGYGPENINIDDPADDTYSVKVHYYEDGGDGEVVATVHIYTYGALVGTWSKVMERNDVWDVADVLWPDGVAVETTTDLYGASNRGCYNP